MAEAADIVRQVARACASTATVLQSHFTAVAVLDAYGPRRRKDWVAAAGEADSYVWSSGSLGGGGSSLWLVPAGAPGLHVPAEQNAIGLRGSGAMAVTADPLTVPADNLLGPDGRGEQIIRDVVLPWFVVLGAAVSLGAMDSAIMATAAAVGDTGSRRPVLLAELARMKVRADSVTLMLKEAAAAVVWQQPDACPAILSLRAAAVQSAIGVTDLAMKACQAVVPSGAPDVERWFRDARAAYAIPPTGARPRSQLRSTALNRTQLRATRCR